jgi:hypothetical protein
MTVGTRSVLFGVHCFFVHPWFVATAWWRLYGAPLDPRLWVSFLVHDLGYLGKPNMDGPEGERHVELGARIMGIFFGREWSSFVRLHSRFYAKRAGRPVSRLCYADKLAIALTPAWLYLPLARASGELREYMRRAQDGKYSSAAISTVDERAWLAGVQAYCRRWVAEHQDGRADTWTPIASESSR